MLFIVVGVRSGWWPLDHCHGEIRFMTDKPNCNFHSCASPSMFGPVQMVCLCQLYQQNSQAWDAHHMVLRLEMCIIMFLQLRRGGTLLPSNWNSVFRSTCFNQNHWAQTHHYVMIWRIGVSHMALLKVGGHFTVPGFRVCSILYISCLYIYSYVL